MTAGTTAKLNQLDAIAKAAETLDGAVKAFRASEGCPTALATAKAAEKAILEAMRNVGKAAVQVDGRLYVDIYAHHVADEDGEGLWNLAAIPAEAVM